jgi:putative Mg2+ transporter-C (MgtC) family protein
MELKSFVIGILICFILSFAVGLERQYRRRFIGLRTTILLAIGTYMFVSMSFIIGASKTDLTRIAAGIVSGISFIGAGVIIKQGNKVQGLTTAATLWCDAAIGALCATGAYYEAILGSCIVIIVNLVLRKISYSVNESVYKKTARLHYLLTIGCSQNNINDIRKEIGKILSNKNYDIIVDNIDINKDKSKVDMEIYFSIKAVQKEYVEEILDKLDDDPDIIKIDVIKRTSDFFEEEGEF